MDNLKTIQSVSKMFSLLSEMGNEKTTEKDRHKIADRKLRFYLTQHGIIKPSDWDNLSIKDKESRLEKLDSFQF
jgi:hypothetical protein